MFRIHGTENPPSRAAWLIVLCVLWTSQALGQHQSHDHPTPPSKPRVAPPSPASPERKPGVIAIGSVKLEIPDTALLDQDGKRVRFYSDLIKGKVVVLSFFFTRCTYACPMQGYALGSLKTRLAGRFGKEVFFISVTKDPHNDTPARLKQWAKDFGVSPGWTLVTGEKKKMGKLLQDFTGEANSQAMHAPILIIGNDRTGLWTEAFGGSTAEELMRVIDRVATSTVASQK